MPLYDYKCEKCNVEFDAMNRVDERHSQVCSECGEKAKLQLPKRAPGLTLFQPGWWRDLDYKPVYINNPQELRNYCDKGNKRANYLEDGIWKTDRGPDPTSESAPELFQGGRDSTNSDCEG